MRLLLLAWTLGIVIVSLVPSGGVSVWNLDKLGHFLAYAGLGALACLSFRDRRMRAWALVGAVVLGGILEIAQNFVPGRDMSAIDGLADTAGVFVGAIAFRLRGNDLSRLVERLLGG